MDEYFDPGWEEVGDEETDDCSCEAHDGAWARVKEDKKYVENWEDNRENYLQVVACLLFVGLEPIGQGAHDLHARHIREDWVDCEQVDEEGTSQDILLPLTLEVAHHWAVVFRMLAVESQSP